MQKKLFVLFFLVTFALLPQKEASANEILFDSLRQQMISLQKTVASLQTTVEKQSQLIEGQASKILFLERRVENISVSPQGRAAVTHAPISSPKTSGLANWNPEIGVIGNVVTHLTEDTEDAEGKDSIVVRELELVFGQYVDPYSRFDAAITLNDALEAQNVEIEQAYLTRYGLPLNFKAQIGKIRPKIGKANLIDRHALDLVTEPLVLSNFFAEEGWKTTGIRLQNFIPNPWDIPLEITGEVLNGRGAASFADIGRRPVFNVHLKSFFELSDIQSLELGTTALFGTDNLDGATLAKGNDRFSTHVFGFDATYLHLMDGIRRVKLQSELYFQNRNFRNPVTVDSNRDGVLDTFVGNLDENPWGLYVLADYKFSPRWSAGIRFDYFKPLDSIEFTGGIPSSATKFGTNSTWEISPYLTLYQSEFALFRLQYSHTENAQGISDNQIYLQARFQIGVDRHGLQ
jgi:hypothetical protein